MEFADNGVDDEDEELEPEEEKARISVYGFTSRPEVQRPNRNGIYIFVNRRLVRDRLILHAVHEAYRNIVPQGVFPATLLFLEMPYDEVDVNVHPAKIEVRFRRSQFVHDFTRDAIRQALMSTRPIASFAVAAGAATSAGNSAQGSGAAPGSSFGTLPAFAEPVNASPGGVPADGPSLVPRALIPGLEEVGLGSGVGSDGGFDLTSAPLQPVPQRFSFEPGLSIGATRSVSIPEPNWAANFAAARGDAPATLPHPVSSSR